MSKQTSVQLQHLKKDKESWKELLRKIKKDQKLAKSSTVEINSSILSGDDRQAVRKIFEIQKKLSESYTIVERNHQQKLHLLHQIENLRKETFENGFPELTGREEFGSKFPDERILDNLVQHSNMLVRSKLGVYE